MSELEDRCWQCPWCKRLRRGERPKACFWCGRFGWWDWVGEAESYERTVVDWRCVRG